MKKTNSRYNRGSSLFAVLFFLVILSIFAGAAFEYSSGTAGMGNRSMLQTQGYGAADAAMELVYARWASVVKGTNLNVSAHALVTPSENSLGIDITSLTFANLGMPTGFLNLPSTFTPAVTIQVIDVYGK